MHKKNTTSWEESSKWYDTIVGKEGHYYHRHVVIPNLLELLDLTANAQLLDLACGQGVLASHIPQGVGYTGVDLSSSLIQQAKRQRKGHFIVGDITQSLDLRQTFTHVTIVLALQNLEHPEKALSQAARHLKKGGILVLVLNHPCFRIPRQSHWGIDSSKQIQYRRIDRYLSPLEIPIQTHPAKGAKSELTLSFHYPLSKISHFLENTGFSISKLEEWTSNKKSTGTKAKMENRAREEFPLFLAIKAQKTV